MEIIYSPQGPPQIIRSHTNDDEDHSIFDFPINDPNDHYNEDNSSYGKKLPSKPTTKYVGKGGSSSNKPKRKKKKKADPPFSPPYSTDNNILSPHPYPSSISIQLNNTNAANTNNNTSNADSPPRSTSKSSEFRSPATTSPGELRQNPTIDSPRGDNELRQNPTLDSPPSDPAASPSPTASSSGYGEDPAAYGEESQMSKQHSLALSQFKTNQLNLAVQSYTTAIQYGLDELTSRKDMVKLQFMGGGREGHSSSNYGRGEGRDGGREDPKVIKLATQLAQVHLDLAQTLEIASKYNESSIELNNGLGLLLHTVGISDTGGGRRDGIDGRGGNEKVKEIKRNISRMERAMNVDIEREKLCSKLDEKMNQLHQSSSHFTSNGKSTSSSSSKAKGGSGKGGNKEQLYKSATSTLKKLLRLERNSTGEKSYIYAKLLLKLSKLKVQHDDNLDEAIKDTQQAVGIMKQVLDKEHTLVGIACTFLGSLFDKKLDLLESKKAVGGLSDMVGGLNGSGMSGGRISTTEVSRGSDKEGEELSKEEKEVITKTIGMYTDSLAPLMFKYTHNNNSNNEGRGRDGINKEGRTLVQPDIAELYHKIAKLYTKLGSGDSSSPSSSNSKHSSSNQDMAIEAYHKSLQFYGITSINRDDITKKKSSTSMLYDIHPNAITVWYDLSTHYLLTKQYNDCVYTSEKCIELYKSIIDSRHKYAFGSSGMEKLERLVVSAYILAGDGYVKLHRYDDAGRCYSEGYYEYKQLTTSSRNGISGKSGLSNTDGSLILQKLGMSYYSRGKLNDAKSYLIDALHTLRSSDNSGGGSERGKTVQMARLLSDIGTVHIKKNEVSEAKKTLRSCLKLYADIGYSDHCTEVEKVKSMYNELQHGVPTSSSLMTSSNNSAMGSPSRHMTAAASVSTGVQSANTPAASTTTMSFMATPRSNATSLTHPSTNYSRSTRSSGSGSGSGLIRSIHSTTNNNQQQLQTLTEVPATISRQASEFTVVASNGTKTVLSPMHCSHHGGGDGSTSTLLHKSINTDPHDMNKLDRKSGGSKEASPSSFDVQLLKTQLEQYQQRIKQVEAERDQEKKERILSNTTHRKEIEAASQSVMKNTVMEAELKQLRKEVHVSETSYQELVKAIDDEKERLTNVHETKVQELQCEIQKLQGRLKYAGAIENVRLSEELSNKKKEIVLLKEQGLKTQQEVMSLQSTVRTLKSEKETVTMNASSLKTKNDQLQSEVQRLSSELASAKAQRVYNSMPQAHANPNSMEIKKLEFELQSERNRRMILEASLQKEYDRSSNNNNNGGYGFPMMPFGYPMMQMGGGQPDNNTVAKMKTLEIDLATEKAGKEMLNNVITELRTTHEQEKESMQAQYSSFLASHEEECSDLMAQVGEKRAEVEILTQEVATIKSDKSVLTRQLDDTMNELSDIKGQLMQKSHELSSAMEEKIILSNTVSSLERTEDELVKTREDLSLIKAELKDEKESLRRMESEGNYLREDNEHIKKEYNEAIQMFKSEIDKVKDVRDDVQTKLETAKEHLHNVMQELEAAHTDSQHFKVALDNTHKDVQSKSEQLRQARRQAKELTESCTELESKVSKLEEIVSCEKKIRADKECDLEQTQGKLSEAEELVEELNETVASLTSNKVDLESRLSVVEDLHERLDAVLCPIPQQLEAVLPDLNSIVPSTRDAPDGEQQADPTPESLGRRISNLLHHISAYNKELHDVIKTRDDTLDKTEWKLSNTTKDLDKLEVKHKELKEELAEMGFLQADYDELLEQYELVVEDKERLDEYLKAIESDQEATANESLLKAQEERDLFESRLKEAVDDLEELESERDAALVELTQAKNESAEKEASLGVRISALETDNKLIETLETQALEYDAALSQKDDKMSKLVEELELAQTELSEIKTKLAKDGVYPEFTKMFPDVDLSQDDTTQEPQELTLSQLATNPFAYDDLSEDESDKEDDKPVNPFDDTPVDGEDDQVVPREEEESNIEEDAAIDYQEESVQLQARVAELEATIDCLNKDIMDMKNEQVLSSTDSVDEIAMSRETDEIDMVRQQEAMVEEVEALKEYIQRLEESNEALSTQLEQSRDDLDAALLSDDEVMTSLREELEGWKNQIVELQLSNDTLKKEMVNKCNTQSDTDSLAEEITSLEHQVQTLEEHNLALSTRLEEAANTQVNQDDQEALTQEIVVLKDEIKALNSSQDELTSQLAESEVKAKEATRLHEEYISSIKEEAGLYDKLQYALDEKDATHKSELEVLNRKLSEMTSQTSSQDDHEDKMIQHNLELATVNAEFHNAMMSMDELTQENLKLKEEINALASKESEEDRNFEEEMNKAHVRFESMERVLHDKVTRLEKEKDKLVADFNAEIVKQEDEHTKTKIELSAWKLEMQNALNDIELLKKERDELKSQLKAYTI